MSIPKDPNSDTRSALEMAHAYARALKNYFGDRLISVVLYGSVARDEHTPASDIDLLIVARDLPASRRARNRLLVQIEEQLFPMLVPLHRRGMYIDFSTKIKTPEKAQKFTPLYLDLTKDAILLYDPEGFFRAILDQLQASLSALGAKRLRQGNVRYWKLKPDYRWGEVIEIWPMRKWLGATSLPLNIPSSKPGWPGAMAYGPGPFGDARNVPRWLSRPF